MRKKCVLTYQWRSSYIPPHISYGQVKTFLYNTSLRVAPRVGYWLSSVVSRFVDEEEAKSLNQCFRGRDYPTNVLTFCDNFSGAHHADVVLCVPVVLQEALLQNKVLQDHYAHLLVHGFLHAYGFDHETEREAQLMEALEGEILTQMSYADPWHISS